MVVLGREVYVARIARLKPSCNRSLELLCFLRSENPDMVHPVAAIVAAEISFLVRIVVHQFDNTGQGAYFS